MSDQPRIRLINIHKIAGTPWSLSKSVRFPSSESDHKSEAINLPSTFKPKQITMGFGQRWQPKAYKESLKPTGNLYLPKGALNSSIGPIFNFKPKRKDDNGVPGPGSYDPIERSRKSSPRVSLKAKFKELTPAKCPSPGSYSPKYTQVFKKQFKEVGFGFGDREFMKNMETDSPAPNLYVLPSEFDKFEKGPRKKSALAIITAFSAVSASSCL